MGKDLYKSNSIISVRKFPRYLREFWNNTFNKKNFSESVTTPSNKLMNNVKKGHGLKLKVKKKRTKK